MPVSRDFIWPHQNNQVGTPLRSRALSMLCTIALMSSSVFAQTGSQDTQGTQPAAAQATVQTPAQTTSPNNNAEQVDYSKPRSILSLWGPYVGRTVASPNLNNAPRIDQILRNGTLYLSLNDAVALALENNLDIAIARYNLDIAETDILRTAAGGTARGVNTGLVSGTPGGTTSAGAGASGGGAGGTTTGAGGAGTGSSGIVSSTSGVGPAIDSFDPVLSGTVQVERATTPQANPVFSGVSNLQQNTTVANFAYTQGWASGTAMSLSFDNTRLTTNSTRTTLNPQLSSSFSLRMRQHLLSGFGLEPNRRFIKIAKNNQQISDLSFRNQVITTVSQIQNIYWDLVNAYQDVKVKERSVELANRTLSDNRKQVEIGTLAPIEIVRAQSEVATRNQDLIISQTNLQLQQLLMKNAITRNLSDSILASAAVVPTDVMVVGPETVGPVQDLVQEALSKRPELLQSRIDLTNRDINKRGARNALLPTLDLIGFYGASGLAGTCNPVATGGVCPPNTGYGTAFSNLFDSSAPDKGVALQLTIPLRNRAAQADQVRSELEYRQAEMRLQQQQNQIAIEVRNAAYAVQQNRARVDAARAARDYAQQSLDAEQKKYALGASTSYLVLQAQRDATQAEVNLVTSTAAYEKSRVELDRVTASTLERNGIVLAEAVTGSVRTNPNVPGVGPAADQTPTATQQDIQRRETTGQQPTVPQQTTSPQQEPGTQQVPQQQAPQQQVPPQQQSPR